MFLQIIHLDARMTPVYHLWPLRVSRPTTWAVCCPTVFAWCLDRLPASQNRGDMAGQVTGGESKTKSHISQTLYQSNILEAQSGSHYLQESQRLQRETCEGFFFPPHFWVRDCCRSAAVLSFVATWHNLRMLLRARCVCWYGINATYK